MLSYKPRKTKASVLTKPLAWLALIGTLLTSPLQGATTALRGAEAEFQAARSKYYSLITSAHTGDETEWQICVGMFRKVWNTYPTHSRAGDALFTEGLLFWNMHQRFGRRESLYQAIQAYEQLSSRYPQNSLADDALYNIAVIYQEDMGDHQNAIKILQRFRTEYPKSDLRPQADLLLKKLERSPAVSKREPVASEPPATSPSVPTNPNVVSTSGEGGKAVKVEEIRYWSNPDYTRVSIYLSQSSAYAHRLLNRDPKLNTPYRLYLDINDAKLTSGVNKQIDIRDSLLQQVRSGQYQTDVARVVLDMNSVYDYQISAAQNPPRIIVDVQGKKPQPTLLPKAAVEVESEVVDAQTHSTNATPTPTTAPYVVVEPKGEVHLTEKPTTSMEEAVRQAIKTTPKSDKTFTIVVDPGHGGEDVGAKGPMGTMEKDVVLDIAMKLRDFLVDYKAVRVVMTRDRDVFIPLQDRSLIANQERGELFISVHANASPKRSASGVSTYIFDDAQDEYSKRLAERENASILRGEKEEPDFLNLMFRSMNKNFFTNLSVELAGAVQGSMIQTLKPRYSGVKDLGVRQAMFYVLWNTEMPSILVETSFISNRTEESRLRSGFYQFEVARAISSGVERYLEKRHSTQLTKLSQR